MKPVPNREEGITEDSDTDDFVPGKRRSAQEVARRCIVLCCVAASPDFSPGYFNDWLMREGLWEDLSPRELKLLPSEEPTRRQTISASWCSEALQVFLWCLGKAAEMSPWTNQVRVRNLLPKMPDPYSDTRRFVESAVLRSDAEIDAELERVIYAHWQLRNEEWNPEQKAPPMVPGVIWERQTALEWIVNFNDEPWDEVTTNT